MHLELHEKTARLSHSHEVRCLVDSGSSMCLLREATARKLQLEWETDNTVIVGFGSDARTQVVGKPTVHIEIDNASLRDVPVFITQDHACKRDLIIRRPWCENSAVAFVKFNN